MAPLSYRFKHFMRAHNHLLTYLGAFIVFSTFIVKEGLGDHWRSTAEALDTAQYMYGIRADARNARRRSEELDMEYQKFRSLIIESLIDKEFKSTPEAEYDIADSQISVAEDIQAELDVELSNLDLLTEQLPHNDAIRHDDDVLHTGRKSAQLQFFKIKKTLNDYSPRTRADLGMRVSNEKLSEVAEELQEEEMDLSNSLRELRGSAAALADSLMVEAKTMRDRNVRYARYSWWISAFLFAIGWGLGLLGKLYGVPEAVGGE